MVFSRTRSISLSSKWANSLQVNRMVTIKTVSIVFTGLSVSLAAFYYISTLRNAQRTQEMQLETRQTQIFMQIYQQLNSEDSFRTWAELMNIECENYDDFLRKYALGAQRFQPVQECLFGKHLIRCSFTGLFPCMHATLSLLVLQSYQRFLFDHVLKRTCRQLQEFVDL